MALFSIGIIGLSGAGKSTIAKSVAEQLGGMYLDTGAMYRAVGLYMKRNGISLEDAAAIAAHVDETPLSVRHIDGVQHVFLGDEDVSEAIRQPDISLAASAVAAVPAVRARLVALAEKHIVEDYEKVLREIEQRDYQDTHRAATPLVQAADAVLVDTSERTLEQSIDDVLDICRRAIAAQ